MLLSFQIWIQISHWPWVILTLLWTTRPWWKTQQIPTKRRRIGRELRPVPPHSKIAGQLTWCNNNCIISMQGFVWVVFFIKAKQAFCYAALLTVDGWFHFFISKGLGKWQFTSIPLTEARICLYNLCKYGHALLLMGIYNNYSGYYKVRRRICVSEPFDKLNLSGKNIKKVGLAKYGDLE